MKEKKELTEIEKIAMPIFGIVLIVALSIVINTIHKGQKQGKTIKQIITEKK